MPLASAGVKDNVVLESTPSAATEVFNKPPTTIDNLPSVSFDMLTLHVHVQDEDQRKYIRESIVGISKDSADYPFSTWGAVAHKLRYYRYALRLHAETGDGGHTGAMKEFG